MEIEYIDLAEIVLSVLDKVSVDYPGAIVKANGMMACLQFIDFFSLHVQRTAVAIVANACRGLPTLAPFSADGTPSTGSERGRPSFNEIFSMVKDVMPTVERLLQYPDQRVLDQNVKCLARIVEWCWRSEVNLEKIVTPSLLDNLIALLVHTTSALAGSATSATTPASAGGASQNNASGTSQGQQLSQVLRILTDVARGSARLGCVLVVEKQVVEMILGIFTGSSAGGENTDITATSTTVTSVVVGMPAEQIVDLLSLLYELLPPLPKDRTWNLRVPSATSASLASGPSVSAPFSKRRASGANSLASNDGDTVPRKDPNAMDTSWDGPAPSSTSASSSSAVSKHQQRLALLAPHRDQVSLLCRRLVPILVDVFGSSVVAAVRKRCVECIARAVSHAALNETATGTAELFGFALRASGTFGKFVSELLQLYEIAFAPVTKDVKESEGNLAGWVLTDRGRKEALFFVAAGAQLTTVVMERCGPKTRDWLGREGVFGLFAKLVEAAEGYAKEPPPVDANVDSSKPPLSPSKTLLLPSSGSEGEAGASSAKLSDVLKDLKRARDQLMGQMGQQPASAGSTIEGPDSQELKRLLETAEKLVGEAEILGKDTTLLTSTSSTLLSRKSEDDAASTTSSKKPNLSVSIKPPTQPLSTSQTSPTSAGFGMLSGMRKMLERLTKGVQGVLWGRPHWVLVDCQRHRLRNSLHLWSLLMGRDLRTRRLGSGLYMPLSNFLELEISHWWRRRLY
ncbi:hypothetical protein BC829DRAFT_259113 [Chytridium lagenaria]|nr:hypothetical protein BC829DRAFT_259113 [Chytridium lagenaria]